MGPAPRHSHYPPSHNMNAMSRPWNPTPPITTLPAMLGDLERADAELHALAIEIDAQPVPRTQLEATALDGLSHELGTHRQRTAEFSAAQTQWAVLASPRHVRTLADFTARLGAYTTLLSTTERRLTQVRLEAERRTGWQGMDDPERHDPITGRYDHPVAHWALFAELLEGHIEDANTLCASLESALTGPHVLDDATLDRVEQQYAVMERETVTGYEWQFARWDRAVLTPAERAGLERLRQLLSDYELRSAQVLAVVGGLKPGTIDRVLTKNDLDLCIEAISKEQRQ